MHLLIDDDEHIREVCRTVAEECGMKGHDVSTAEEALEVMEAFSIDILLTDLRLPGMEELSLAVKEVLQRQMTAAVGAEEATKNRAAGNA